MSKRPFADWPWTPELVAMFARANRHLDTPMRARALEVERALVEAMLPVSNADQRGMDERGRPGDACARMVAAYDD